MSYLPTVDTLNQFTESIKTFAGKITEYVQELTEYEDDTANNNVANINESNMIDWGDEKNLDDEEVCKHYISRKDRERRGKREKKGRVMMTGHYHEYDDDSLQYFRFYKNVTRGVKNGVTSTAELGYSGAVQLYEGSTVLTDTLLMKSHPPFSSELIDDMPNGSISFSGGGYNCAYHLGIVKYIFENNHLFENATYLGASGGAGVAAIALAYQTDPNRMRVLQDILNTLTALGDENYTLSEQVERYTQLLLGYIDLDRFDKYIKENNRLQISLTEVTNYIPTNRIVTQFRNLTHLEKTIRASACVPILLDNRVRKIEDRSFLDGGFTNNLPIINNRTIRISCLNYPTLQAEIHPQRYLDLMTCFVHPGEEVILRMMENGYVDFIKYINPYIEKEDDERLEEEIKLLESEFAES
jgi:patatin-like phospholipase